eukprot:2036795-Pyramimonas_sp.AAC.2
MSFDVTRLQKELVEIQRDKASGVSVEMTGDSLAHLQGSIKGIKIDPLTYGASIDFTIEHLSPFSISACHTRLIAVYV